MEKTNNLSRDIISYKSKRSIYLENIVVSYYDKQYEELKDPIKFHTSDHGYICASLTYGGLKKDRQLKIDY